MLDKSIPWHSVIMRLGAGAPLPPAPPPDGFFLRAYRGERDGRAWAAIETAVGEFASQEEALACHRHYLDREAELYKRQWFAVDGEDHPVATASCWWSGKENLPCLHAWSCLPAYQNRGLGLAVVVRALRAAQALHPNQAIYLETQTWSYRAVELYLRLGFVPLKTAVFNDTPNDYALSLPLLKQKLSAESCKRFEAAAV